eukprot:scaffold1293_cov375-Prasinococcus_capsulatus_cf.AAC.22
MDGWMDGRTDGRTQPSGLLAAAGWTNRLTGKGVELALTACRRKERDVDGGEGGGGAQSSHTGGVRGAPSSLTRQSVGDGRCFSPGLRWPAYRLLVWTLSRGDEIVSTETGRRGRRLSEQGRPLSLASDSPPPLRRLLPRTSPLAALPSSCRRGRGPLHPTGAASRPSAPGRWPHVHYARARPNGLVRLGPSLSSVGCAVERGNSDDASPLGRRQKRRALL